MVLWATAWADMETHGFPQDTLLASWVECMDLMECKTPMVIHSQDLDLDCRLVLEVDTQVASAADSLEAAASAVEASAVDSLEAMLVAV